MITQINDIKVKPLKTKNINKPYKYENMFPNNGMFSNVFISSKKNSGKTSLVWNILKHICTNMTKVIIFSSTASTNDTMRELIRKLDKYNIDTEVYNDLFDEDEEGNVVNVLQSKIAEMKDCIEKNEDIIDSDTYDYPLFICVFDDISEHLRNKKLVKFLKENRAYRCFNIISSQYYCDIPPGARSNLQFLILYSDIPKDKLKLIFSENIKRLGFEDFYKIYIETTSVPYQFLYINKEDYKDIRINFDKRINLTSIENPS